MEAVRASVFCSSHQVAMPPHRPTDKSISVEIALKWQKGLNQRTNTKENE